MLQLYNIQNAVVNPGPGGQRQYRIIARFKQHEEHVKQVNELEYEPTAIGTVIGTSTTAIM